MFSRRWLLAAGLAPAPALLAAPAQAEVIESPALLIAVNRQELANARPDAMVEGVILSGYHAPGDGGGAQYRRSAQEPPHPGKIRSADGAWWELMEPRPTPEMFGANGTYEGDTPALQACCDYVRINCNYGRHGRADQGTVHLLSRTYLINQSIDFTSDGSKFGWGIVGEGKTHTIVMLKLDEPFPGIDACGVAEFFIRSLQIKRDPADKSSCSLLLAKVQGAVFHNAAPVLEDIRASHGGPNSVAAIIIHCGDTASISRVDGQNDDAPAMYIGGSVPVLLHGPYRPGPTATTLDLGPQASTDNTAYIGRSVRLFRGVAVNGRPVRTIVAYDPSSKIATIDSPWPTAPDPLSQFEIFAVQSKYHGLSNDYDATQYRLSSCSLGGSTACVFKGGTELTAINTYFAAVGKGDAAVFLVDAHQLGGNALSVRFFNARWENQTQVHRNNQVHSFLTYNVLNVLEIHGDISSEAYGDHADVGRIATRQGGAIRYLGLYGSCPDPKTPLFDIQDAQGAPGQISHVEGFFQYDTLGTIGRVGTWRLDNNYDPPGMLEALNAICGAGEYHGVPFTPNQARLNGVAGTVTQVLALQPFDPALTPTQGGKGPQARVSFTIPSHALANATPTARRRVQVDVHGRCPKDTRISVGVGTVVPTPNSGAFDSGRFSVKLLIMRTGSSLSWSGELWNGQVMLADFDGNLASFDDTAALTLNLIETSGTNNALNPMTSFGLLM